MNPNLDALVINGDLGDGRSDDYAMLNSILQKYPLPKTVYYTLSNHEFYKAYYIQGYHFIFLGSEQYRQSDPANYEDAWLSSAQLSWLQKKLQENYFPAQAYVRVSSSAAARHSIRQRRAGRCAANGVETAIILIP